MIPRFGDAYHELPARCWLASPARAPEHWTRFPVSQYEGLVSDLLGMCVPVPGHPAACTTKNCGHAQVWHAHKTRDHACRAEGCRCTKLERADQSGVPWAVPVRAAR
jgi:hypothetical protein